MWKVSKYGAFSGPYFPVFGLNTGKYGPEKTPYLDTFYAELRETIFFFFLCRGSLLNQPKIINNLVVLLPLPTTKNKLS